MAKSAVEGEVIKCFEVVNVSEGDSMKVNEEELQSLEYEEDCFYDLTASNSTPSFDLVNEG